MKSTSIRHRSRRRWGVALALALGLTAVPYAEAAAPAAPIKVIQNYSETLEPNSSAACAGFDNMWLRRFLLADEHDAATGFELSAVTLGHQDVIPADGSIPLTVEAYAIDTGDDLLLANLEPLATTSIEVAGEDQNTLETVPLAASVPVGKDLVIAVSELGADGVYFIGGNQQPQSATAYIVAPGCSVTEPTAVDLLVPGHLVFYGLGKSGECVSAESATMQAESSLAAATKAYAKAKKAAKKAKKKAAQAKKKFGSTSKQYKKAKKAAAKKAKKAKQAKKKAARAKKAVAAAQSLSAAECAQPLLPAPPDETRSSATRSSGVISTGAAG